MPEQQRRGRRRAIRIVSAAVALTALGAGAWVAWGHRADQSQAAQAAGAPVPAAVTAAPPRPCTRLVTGPSDPTLAWLIANWTRTHPASAISIWRTDSTCPISIVAHNPNLPLLPASNDKLITSAGALLTLGPTFRYATRIVAPGSTLIAHHVVSTPITLVGSGDPLFSTYAYARLYLGSNGDTLNALAAQLRKADGSRPAITKITGGIRTNGSIFDVLTLPPDWSASDIGSIEPLSGIPTDEDFAGTGQATTLADPVLAAAQRMRSALRADKVSVTGALGYGRVPAAPLTLAEVTSPPLSTILRIMNVPSDDFIAEQLLKTIDAQAHAPGRSTRGAARVVATLTAIGVLRTGDRVVDGSGLARADRLTADTLLRLLLDAQRNPQWGAPLIASLPAPGQGTLKGRLSGLTTRVRAKTGTLNDVSSLSGVVHAADGKTYAFSILTNGLHGTGVTASRAFQDQIVRRLAHGVAG